VAGCHPVAASLMLIVMERSRCASCSRPSRSDGPHTTGPGPDCSDHPAPATRGGLPRWALAAVVVGRARLLSVVQRPVSCAPHSPRSPALLCSPRRHARSHSNHAAHGGCQGKPCHEAAALLPAAGRGRGGGLAAQRLHTQCVVQGGPTCSKGGARALRHPCCCCSPRCCARRVARVPPQAASLGELHQALRAGFAPERVVFDSPAKTVAELRCVRACAANAVCCRQAPCAPPPPPARHHTALPTQVCCVCRARPQLRAAGGGCRQPGQLPGAAACGSAGGGRARPAAAPPPAAHWAAHQPAGVRVPACASCGCARRWLRSAAGVHAERQQQRSPRRSAVHTHTHTHTHTSDAISGGAAVVTQVGEGSIAALSTGGRVSKFGFPLQVRVCGVLAGRPASTLGGVRGLPAGTPHRCPAVQGSVLLAPQCMPCMSPVCNFRMCVCCCDATGGAW
jgi:hypothetical protein